MTFQQSGSPAETQTTAKWSVVINCTRLLDWGLYEVNAQVSLSSFVHSTVIYLTLRCQDIDCLLSDALPKRNNWSTYA